VPATADGDFLPLPPSAAFLAQQESRQPPSSAPLRPQAVQARSACRLVIATKAAMGAADPEGIPL
jgi:hypothetical protein